jgi:integrase
VERSIGGWYWEARSLKVKLPKYIKAYVDQAGKARYYFRRAGFKGVALPGLPYSPEFMRAYEDALAGQPIEVGAGRVIPGSMHALAISYYNHTSSEYLRMKPNSQRVRRNVIEHFCRERDVNGRCNGDKPAAILQREHIKGFMAARADRPGSANALRKALRALMQHAVEIKIRSDDPTQGIKPLPARSRQGFHTWDETEIAQYEAHHPIGSMARLALALGLYTGQARQDVIAMGPQHIRGNVLKWERMKTARSTGREIDVDLNDVPELRRIIDATPSGHLTFLTAPSGVRFTLNHFTWWFRKQCDAAGLPRHCTFHGLRKACARRMAEAECSPHEIMSVTGHASLKEADHYSMKANRSRLRRSAWAKVRRGTSSV